MTISHEVTDPFIVSDDIDFYVSRRIKKEENNDHTTALILELVILEKLHKDNNVAYNEIAVDELYELLDKYLDGPFCQDTARKVKEIAEEMPKHYDKTLYDFYVNNIRHPYEN